MNTYGKAGIIVVAVLIVVAGAAYWFLGVRPSPEPATNRTTGELDFVDLPDGFSIQVFAGGFGGSSLSYPGPNPGPRFMAVHNETLYVSIPNQGRIVALRDIDSDPRADETVTVVDGLNRPHGLDFHDDHLYVANTDSVVRFAMQDIRADQGSRETLVTGIPTGGHWTRTLQVWDDQLYITVGSSCNVCEESNRWRAAMTVCGLDGSNCSTFAEGLRNTVGFIRVDGRIYGTDNGRDNLGNDVPPDEINIIQEGNHYGWPYCYGDQQPDPAFDRREFCQETEPAAKNLQAHSAPLGLTYYNASGFPERFRDSLYVGYHGSWNRQPPTGYKVVRISVNGDGSLGEVREFASGWLDGTRVRGRPVDVVAMDGDLFVSDDNTGMIYRVTYEGR